MRHRHRIDLYNRIRALFSSQPQLRIIQRQRRTGIVTRQHANLNHHNRQYQSTKGRLRFSVIPINVTQLIRHFRRHHDRNGRTQVAKQRRRRQAPLHHRFRDITNALRLFTIINTVRRLVNTRQPNRTRVNFMARRIVNSHRFNFSYQRRRFNDTKTRTSRHRASTEATSRRQVGQFNYSRSNRQVISHSFARQHTRNTSTRLRRTTKTQIRARQRIRLRHHFTRHQINRITFVNRRTNRQLRNSVDLIRHHTGNLHQTHHRHRRRVAQVGRRFVNVHLPHNVPSVGHRSHLRVLQWLHINRPQYHTFSTRNFTTRRVNGRTLTRLRVTRNMATQQIRRTHTRARFTTNNGH